MAKQKRPLTRQTREALDGIVKPVADEIGLEDGSYLYKILADNGSASDPYAHFKPLFRAVCRTSLIRARVWLDDINSIFDKATASQSQQSNFHVQSNHVLNLRAQVDSILAGRNIELLSREEQRKVSRAFSEIAQAAETATMIIEDSLKTEAEVALR